MRILKSKEVCVIPMQRRWKDRKFPDFVLSATINARKDIPPFYHPPEGTEEYRIMKRLGQKVSEAKKKVSLAPASSDKPKEGFQNIAHMGPLCTGKPLESFVIILNDENPVCVMNTSAQFSKMSVDYYFEKPNNYSNDFIVTLFIEGQAVADAKGPKKMLKHRVSELALQCLNKFCLTVVTNKDVLQTCNAISRRDIKGNQAETSTNDYPNEDGSIGGIGEKMMKMMGWTEGGEIGDRFKVKRDLIKIENESINREGLGSKAIDSDNITREEAQDIVKQYAASDSVDELVFSSELNFDERMEIRYMAKRFNLAEKMVAVPFGKGKKIFLVLSKKVDNSVIIQQLEKDGQFGKYQLIRPAGGDRMAVNKYLNFQNLRKNPGVPEEIQMGESPKDNSVSWKDKSRIKPLMKSYEYRRCTTFDSSGRIKSADEFFQSRIEDATKCILGQGAASFRTTNEKRGSGRGGGGFNFPHGPMSMTHGEGEQFFDGSQWNDHRDFNHQQHFGGGFNRGGERGGVFNRGGRGIHGLNDWGQPQPNCGFEDGSNYSGNAGFGNGMPGGFGRGNQMPRFGGGGRSNFNRGDFSRFGRRGC